MPTLKANDTIYGAMGRAYVKVDGQNEELLYAKNIEATIEKTKTEVPVLGQTGKKHKAGGWTGTGSMTIYYSTTFFRKMMMEYVKSGKDTYFDMVVENEDPTSEIGKQTILLKGCNLDNVMITQIDIETESMEESMDFTFNDVEILNEFDQAIGE